MSGTVLAIISDTHIGSTTGLATPTYRIQTRDPNETQEVNANRLQKWLWECWQDFWAYVRQERKVASKSRRIADYEGVLVGNEEAQAPPCWNAGSLPATLF